MPSVGTSSKANQPRKVNNNESIFSLIFIYIRSINDQMYQ